MILLVFEAHVAKDRWSALRQAFATVGTRNLPTPLYEAMLVQDTADPTHWQIVTLWRSRQDLDEVLEQGTPPGTMMFRLAGAEPTMTIWEVVERGLGPALGNG